MKKIILVFISIILSSCQGQTTKSIQTIDEKMYAEKLSSIQNPQLIDVRTPEEYSVEHLENATNINWNGNDFTAKAEKLDKLKPVFVYCKVGGRSSQAANKLSELGFKEIYNLDGGIMKWSGNKTTATNAKPSGISANDYQKLINSNQKVLINFNAKWCAPCKKMAPYVLKMQEELKESIAIIRLDADENKTILDEMKLDGLPVIILYENGKETWRNIGFISEEDLRKKL